MKKFKKSEMNSLLKDINKSMKTELFMLGPREVKAHPHFPTGMLPLDEAIGIGGYPIGKQVEIAGSYSVGKSHLALEAVRQVQLLGGTAAFIDLESSANLLRFAEMGVNIEELLLGSADYLEQGLDAVEAIIPAVDLIVFDSIATSTKAEFEKSAEEDTMGIRAKKLTANVPKLSTLCKHNETTIIWINQKRAPMGSMANAANTTVTPGGNNFKHMMHVRIWMDRVKTIDRGDETIGHWAQCLIEKNKVGPPKKKCLLPFLFETGFSKEWMILDMAEELQLIVKKGNYLKTLDGSTIGNGMYNSVQFMIDNPEYTKELEDEIRKSLFAQE